MAGLEGVPEAPIPSLMSADYAETTVAIQIVDVIVSEEKLKTTVTYKIRVGLGRGQTRKAHSRFCDSIMNF